jgi:hypothetical protein
VSEERKHEAHGFCKRCLGAVHRYPDGWHHVNLNLVPRDGRACKDEEIRLNVTCCGEHERMSGSRRTTPA